MRSILCFIFTFIIIFTGTVKAEDVQVSDEERLKIEKVLEEYLLEKPEIIAIAIRELQRRQTMAQMLPAIKMYRHYLENSDVDGILGNPNGDVVIVEFFDYRCGFCRRHYAEVKRLVKEDGNIKWVLKHFPILDRPGEPALSHKAAMAAIAATKQGKFAEFHDALMTGSGNITEDYIMATAEEVGLDMAKFKDDLINKVNEKIITNSLSVGQDIGFSGTPGYVIGDDAVLGAEGYDRLKEAVLRAREEQQSKATK